MPEGSKAVDPFSRGRKGFDVFGSLAMVIGRLGNIPLQTAALCTPLLNPLFQRLGIVHHPAIFASMSQISPNTLAAIPTPRLLLLGISATNAIVQANWAWNVSLDPVSLSSGFQVSVMNIVIDTIWTALYLSRTTSSTADESHTSWALFAFAFAMAGTFIEMYSEHQRRVFKKDPANKGKLYSGGLFSLARHINYTGFSMSRVAQGLLASGWTAGVVWAAFALWDLGGRAAAILDEYCGKRYGQQWEQYKRKVPSKMIPGIY